MRNFEYWLRGTWALLGFGFKGQTVAVYRHRYRHVTGANTHRNRHAPHTVIHCDTHSAHCNGHWYGDFADHNSHIYHHTAHSTAGQLEKLGWEQL